LVLIGSLGFAATPLAAASMPPVGTTPIETPSNIIKVAGGCGPGYHPESFRDRYGYWHRRCVSNYGPGPHHPPPYAWPEPRWGWGWRGY